MPGARTPGKWPYRAATPVRGRRVVKTRDGAQRGVRRRTEPEPRYRITRTQARLVLAAALVMALLSAAWWAYHSPWVTVEHVQVRGTQQLSPDLIRSTAGVDGKSVFRLDLKAAQARVAALPMVKSATVTKHGWNGVSVDVQERTAWGSWQMNGVNVPIDAEGYVLDGPPAPAGSPVIVEANPHRVLNAGDRLDPGAIELAARLVRESEPAFGRTVQALVYRQDAGIIAVLSGSPTDDRPIWVTFGDARDYDYKVAALYVLIQQAQDEDLTLNTVDLRFGDRLSFN